MRVFSCPACQARLFFDNRQCLACGTHVVLDPVSDQMWPLAGNACANRAQAGCNWVAAPGSGGMCLSCAQTRTIPDLGVPANAAYWRDAEGAKRWVLWGLMRLGWFLPSDPGPRPIFDLVAEDTGAGPVKVTMGHADGVITLNVSESDPARLAQRRVELGEAYRSMVGHLRHELAHFLHWRRMDDPGFAEAFRALFGDERADYAAALARHYDNPQPAGDAYISSYATAHPHEDWAETAAHTLHLLDITDSFAAAGLRLDGADGGAPAYAQTDGGALIDQAARIGVAMNHINRAMGLSDLYPFVLTPGLAPKLNFALAALRRA